MANITILPQSTKSRLAEQVGQSLAEGMAKRLPKPEHETIRKQQRGALDEFKGMLSPQDTPADIALKFAQSTAGIPGAENWANSILPAYQKQAGFNVYGGAQNPYGNQQQGSSIPQTNNNIGVSNNPNIRNTSNNQQNVVQNAPQKSLGGISSLFPNQQPMQNQGGGGVGLTPNQGPDAGLFQRAALTGQTPTEALAFEQNVPQQQVATEITKQESERYNTLADQAKKVLAKTEGKIGEGGVVQIDPESVRRFIDIGKKYQGSDMATWLKKTTEDYNTFKNATNAIDEYFVPGATDFIPKFFGEGKSREDAVAGLHDKVSDLLNLGEEELVRRKLTDKGLGPTETESVIRPPREELNKEIKTLPKITKTIKGPKGEEREFELEKNPKLNKQIIDKTSDFLRNNLTDDDSLLVLRDKLINEKGYTWRQYEDALDQAVKNGLVLSSRQRGELGDLSKPPRDSLLSIFYHFGNLVNLFTGAK